MPMRAVPNGPLSFVLSCHRMAVKAQALVTRDAFKTAIGVSGTTDDTKIDSIIDRATAWIESKTGRLLKARNYNGAGTAFTTTVTSEDYLFFDGDSCHRNERGFGVLYVPQFPVLKQSVASALAVELAALTTRTTGADGAGDTWDTSALLEGRDYIVDYTNGIITLIGGIFSTGQKNYRLKCTAGYATIPDDLEALCIELARGIYKDNRAVTSETLGTWSRSFSEALKKADPLVQDTLAKYTRYAL